MIFFILPILLTKRESIQTEVTVNQEDTTSKNEEECNYNNFGTIKLLHSKTGEIEEVKIDEYLCNVVSAEMPADYEIEALKAQAVVARTYTIYKIKNKKHDNADICDDSSCCQAWVDKQTRFSRWDDDKKESNWNRIEQCVNGTKGLVITYQGEPINAFFHANSGGKTELAVDVWGGSNLPYLQVVETAGEEGYTQYASSVEFTKEELLEKLKTKYNDITIDFNNAEDIKITEYTTSGRVRTVKFGNHSISGVEARTQLGLKSTNFEITKENEKIKFIVKGYGHGVGMSQTGADTLAKEGKNYEDIINHFYKDIEIKDVNSL